MKIKTIQNLIILGTIVFTFGLANTSSAYSCRGYDCDYNYSASYGYRSIGSGSNDNYDEYDSRINERTIVNNYYYGEPSSSSTKTIASTSKAENSDSKSGSTSDSSLGILDSSDSGVDGNLLGASAANGLTALSLHGSGGFMPSSIWQWILAGILLLIIIILIRVLINNSSKNSSHGH